MTSQMEPGKLGLSKDKKELLDLLLKEKGIQTPQANPITRRGPDVPPPLSFAQERLWVLYQMEPDSAYYNIPFGLRLSGVLDVAALEASLTTILERHEVLRAIFPMVNGQPAYRYLPHQPMRLPITDLSGLPEAQRQAGMQHLAADEAQRHFKLESGPLLRAQLIKMSDIEHVLLLTVHHIVADGISYSVFMRELNALYAAHRACKPSPLPGLPFQFADFAHWQRNWMQGEVLEKQLAYWQQRLGGLATLELPLDKPRPAVQTYTGKRQSVTLPQAMAEGLRALSRKQGVSLYATMLAAFQVLLGKYAGQDDVVVGSPVAGRNYQGIENLVGLFINTLVLRADLSENPSFENLLTQVHRTVLEAYEHQDLPFEKLVEVMRPERDLSRTPLFQVLFNFQNSLVVNMQMDGVSVRLLEQPSGIAKFDLTMDVNEVDDKITVALEYNVDLFHEDTIRRMLGHFQNLLSAALADPRQPVRSLPLMTETERKQIVVDWNANRTEYPREASIAALFESQAAKTPDTIALTFAGQGMTYRELNERANRLAHLLRAQGLTAGEMVGVCLERSPELIVALLAVLKAGGAYLPLDAGYPKERLAYMLADTKAPLLLTAQALLGSLPEHSARVICLDQDADTILAQPAENVPSEATGSSLAYVMYTSGSTGTIKGVTVPQRAVVRLVKNNTFITIAPDDVFLQLAPVSFDASTLEIWASLLNGCRLAIFPPHAPTLSELGDVIAQNGVTILWLTAGLFHQMVDENIRGLAGLRQLLAGGDVLSVPHVEKVLRQFPGLRLINGYGPTENTTFTCCYPVTQPEQISGSLPIGRPIANTQVYVLDRWMQPVPVGVVGELYAGGDGLATGYLNQPELTAERFIANPFSADPNDRLYKTGDLVRYLPDGAIEFLGRNDLQVKVRGFRVELGEIETVLSAHPLIQTAAIVVREDRPNDKSLAAFLVPAGRAPSFTELTSYLRKKLPEYMIPSAFTTLTELPLNPNGKVDRRALAEMGKAAQAEKTGYVAPRTPVEAQLVAIWEDVMQQEKIGVDDNFFELGGHSLLAMRIISRMQETFQVPLSLRLIYEAHTVAEMAEKVVALQNGETGDMDGEIGRLDRGADGDEALLADLDQLSDEEVDALLEQMLSKTETK